MSQENVEAIERGYEALSRLDAGALVALCEPDVEFHSRIAEAEHVTYRGHDGVRDYVASMSEAFEWIRTEALEVIDGGERIVVCNRFRARGRGRSRGGSGLFSRDQGARWQGRGRKPWGCGSSRCRRRTWSWGAPLTKRLRDATAKPSPRSRVAAVRFIATLWAGTGRRSALSRSGSKQRAGGSRPLLA
jgi:ketosteroid isomerase-like protein